jgi:hypothetical protein
MMLIGWLGLGCALLSAMGIAILAMVDPKRRRDERRAARPGLRWLLTLSIFIPGVALSFAGRWTDFLIWIGAAAIFGWAIAALANVGSRGRNKEI